MKLNELCGQHIFSGCEIGTEHIENNWGPEDRNILLFTLDGVTYKLVENPSDGYRSYCEEIQISDSKPKYTFPGVQVVCSMMEHSDYENNDCIVIRDIQNGKMILEAGTKNYDDWYPYCVFNYMPQNMACNGGR